MDTETQADGGPPRKHRKRVLIALLIVLLLVVGTWVVSKTFLNRPVDYDDIVEHFKYGSIGSESANGIPYWIWKVLPEMFPEKLPGKGYESLGFLKEEGHDTPIGFTRRRVPIDRVGLNCAVCHTGTVRETPSSPRQIIAGMPANNLDLQAYVEFLAKCAQDSRFSPRYMMPAIEGMGGKLSFVERFIYRNVAIYQTRDALITQGKQLELLTPHRWGIGRVDTFNPYKALKFYFPMDKLPPDELIGASDLPSIWNQGPREHMQLHWDGNNTSVEERNKSAALGAGVTPTTIDLPRLKRVEDWLRKLEAPAYPYLINNQLAAAGKPLYELHCAACHAFGGMKTGKVTPISEIATDRHRLDSYTYDFLSNQNTLYAGYPWRFQHFRKTNGYANQPLDGIWLRAPYLHNGSVPTLRDLLEPVELRPTKFYRGYDVFDQKKVGFVSDLPEENGRRNFQLNTSEPGNANTGHLYGIDLSPEQKDAIVEYMKKL
jgi:RoxA-like, cytochrome c-like